MKKIIIPVLILVVLWLIFGQKNDHPGKKMARVLPDVFPDQKWKSGSWTYTTDPVDLHFLPRHKDNRLPDIDLTPLSHAV